MMDEHQSINTLKLTFENSDNPSENSDNSYREEQRNIKKCFGIRKMYIAAGSALFLALTLGLAAGYSAPATYDMEYRSSSRVEPTKDEITWISSIVVVGVMLGNIFAGPLADKIGRKDTLVFNAIPAVLGWLIICYAKTALVIITGRLFCGISCGVICVIIPTYCVEISTAEVRGLLGSSYQGFLVIGHFISVTIGSYVTWDYLALNGAVFSVFGMIWFTFMPESPRWLLEKGQLKEAISVTNYLQGGYIDAEKECYAIYKDIENQPKGRLTLREFMHPTVYKPTIIAIIIFFFNQFSGVNAIFSYSSDIFENTKDFLDPKKATIVLAVFQVVATLMSNFLVDKVGRKILLIISGTFMTLTLAVLGIYYYMSFNNSDFEIKYNWIPLLSLLLFVIAYSIGYGPIAVLLAAEMLPTRARSTASGLIFFCNSTFGFIVIKSFEDLRSRLKYFGAFWFYSAFSFVGVLFLVFFVPETKGKKLEEIGKIFHSQKQTEPNIDIAVIS